LLCDTASDGRSDIVDDDVNPILSKHMSNPRDFDGDRMIARQQRKARRRQERRAQRANPGPQHPLSTPPPEPADDGFLRTVGPLGRRVGRIAGNMVIKQILKAVFGALLRR
jgi:hypothetical protein